MDPCRFTPAGLQCVAGNFHVDPWQPVPVAIVTHAHADHARPGSELYICAAGTEALLRNRLGADVRIRRLEYGERARFGDAIVSLHAAGHVLGSAQVRIEAGGETWVVTGDYKRVPDPTCTAFEVVRCDVLVTEATFALPIYRWRSTADVLGEVHQWWQQARTAGRAAVLFCYALGKAQRLLAELAAFTSDPVYVHGALLGPTEAYRAAGVRMLPTLPVADTARGQSFAGALVLAPESAMGSPWLRRFGDFESGFASGWMRVRGNRRRRNIDRGFELSDHADWPGLLKTVQDTGARRVIATHGYAETLARYLGEQGLRAEAATGTDAERRSEDEG